MLLYTTINSRDAHEQSNNDVSIFFFIHTTKQVFDCNKKKKLLTTLIILSKSYDCVLCLYNFFTFICLEAIAVNFKCHFGL